MTLCSTTLPPFYELLFLPLLWARSALSWLYGFRPGKSLYDLQIAEYFLYTFKVELQAFLKF